MRRSRQTDARAVPPAVDGDFDFAGENVAQRQDDGRAVVAPHGAVAVFAGEVDSQVEFVDVVAGAGAEEGFDQVSELGGGVGDFAAVVVVC